MTHQQLQYNLWRTHKDETIPVHVVRSAEESEINITFDEDLDVADEKHQQRRSSDEETKEYQQDNGWMTKGIWCICSAIQHPKEEKRTFVGKNAN